MFDILMINFVTIALLLGFILLLRTGDVFDQRTERLLSLASIAVAMLVVVDIIDNYYVMKNTVHNIRYLTSALGYVLRVALIGIFITILLRNKQKVLYIWIPIIIVAMIALTNYWTHLMFYFDESNKFTRGTLGFLVHIMSFGYIVLLIYYAIRRFKVTDTGEIIIVFYVAFICTTAVIAEAVFMVKFLVSGAAVASCTIYYTYLYVQVYKMDPLTKTFNRTSFNKDVEKRLNKSIAIINVDLDNLKHINDTKGHVAGDKALFALAEVLKAESDNKYRVYRVGGDEFYVLGLNKSSVVLEEYIKNVKKALSRKHITASFGYAQYRPGSDFSNCCMIADEMMYEDKKNKPQL